MKLSQQAIEEYRALVKKHFGEELTFEEAKIRAEEFLRFYSIIHKPIKKDWLKKKKQKMQ